MAEQVQLAMVGDIPENGMRAFSHGDRQILLYRIGDTFYATDNICSHEYAELDQGYLEPEDCTIECPLHGSRFNIATGQVLTLPAYEPIAVYPVSISDDTVFVEI